MRQQLDIYASVVLCKTVPGVPARHRDVDFAIIRENTEGEYAGLEHQVRAMINTRDMQSSILTPLPYHVVLPWCRRVAQDHDPSQV